MVKRARKLKVFQTRMGFFDTVVAAPSQAAALRAWGVRQNLFAGGEAQVTSDTDAARAALEHPETPLRRPVGTREAYTLDPTSSPRIPAGKAPKRRAIHAESPRPPADRSHLDQAEAALARLETHRKREEADLKRRREALERGTAEARTAYAAARKAAHAAVSKARKAYRAAGGTD